MNNTSSVQKSLLQAVQQHEQYIRTACVIQRGSYGDFDRAQDELLNQIENEFGSDAAWDFDINQGWFIKLIWRQAKCNFYECE